MIAADSQTVAVTGNYDHLHMRFGELDAGSEGEGASMGGVEGAEIEVDRHATSAADS